MKVIAVFFTLFLCSTANGQGYTKRALFLGNSYTQVNNLPQMISNVTKSTGDTLIFDSNTPGGYTFKGHSTNTNSLAKISAVKWDYVVLQEQSQLPAFPISQVESDVFPFASFLDSLIKVNNPCAETVFYMTWGRKNGDAANCPNWPPVCTYLGMDSLLSLRYRMMTEDNNAILSPVGAVWKYIRQNHPEIELYAGDGSHPSVAGTYAAACSFYSALFRKDPTLITFNSSLSATDAMNIRNVAKLIVYDSLLNWHVGEYDPQADFTYDLTGKNQISFTNSSANAIDYYWNFGDGDTSTIKNPVHSYLTSGSFNITLIATSCGLSDTTSQTIDIISTGVNQANLENNLIVFPNPATSSIQIKHGFTKTNTYKILSSTGQEIQTGLLTNPEEQINVSSLAEGVYFLQLLDNNLTLGQEKFIIIAKK